MWLNYCNNIESSYTSISNEAKDKTDKEPYGLYPLSFSIKVKDSFKEDGFYKTLERDNEEYEIIDSTLLRDLADYIKENLLIYHGGTAYDFNYSIGNFDNFKSEVQEEFLRRINHDDLLNKYYDDEFIIYHHLEPDNVYN